MQKIEARRWNTIKETFRDYAMDKLALMHRLKLEEKHKIKLLIKGINNLSIKCAAATLRVNSVNQFIREMDEIVESCGDSFKKFQYTDFKSDKTKDLNSKNGKPDASNLTGKNGSHSNNTKAQSHCVYCHAKDHSRDNCPKLRKKQQQESRSSQKPNQTSSVSAIEENNENSKPTVACVQNLDRKIITSDSLIEINEILGETCSMYALVDTGSPISFINAVTFSKLKISAFISLKNQYIHIKR